MNRHEKVAHEEITGKLVKAILPAVEGTKFFWVVKLCTLVESLDRLGIVHVDAVINQRVLDSPYMRAEEDVVLELEGVHLDVVYLVGLSVDGDRGETRVVDEDGAYGGGQQDRNIYQWEL